jgi:uncharacterized alpha-E superfamily protein
LNIRPYFTEVISRYTEHAHNHIRLGNQFLSSGRAYSAHSTAETVNSEVFQVANGLVECKEGHDDAKQKVSVYSFS